MDRMQILMQRKHEIESLMNNKRDFLDANLDNYYLMQMFNDYSFFEREQTYSFLELLEIELEKLNEMLENYGNNGMQAN